MSLQDYTDLAPHPKRFKPEFQDNDNVVKAVEGAGDSSSLAEGKKAEERDFLPPFEGFSVDSLLSVYPRSKTIAVSGKFSGSSKAAVIVAEKVPLTEADLSNLFSSETRLNRSFQNDIYAQYTASSAKSIGDLKLVTVYPASDAHVQKYSFQKLRMVHETPEDYQTITRPFIEKQSLAVEWVYNILSGKSEADRVVYNDPDPDTGFVLVPDMKWDQKGTENLYMQALVRRKGILSMRELSGEHLPLLKNILHHGKQAIEREYDISGDQLRVYVHYQPSYYHLHVHFTHLKYEAPKTLIGQAHLLEEIVDNIENIDHGYYQKKTLSFVLKELSPLWQEFLKKKGLPS